MSAVQCRKATWFYTFYLSGVDHISYPKHHMTCRSIEYMLTNKNLIILICMIGVVAVSYGMLTDNTLIFIIGLICILAGYLLIRRKIKESIRNKT